VIILNKNGFIATSLIYTFFIMFISLFLTIIADYLQNKVLLDTTEKGIKDELNSKVSIKDFEVGNPVSFVSDCSNINAAELYIIAKVDYNNSKLILYSYELNGTSTNYLKKSDIDNDFLNSGYNNATYYNKILYTFSTSGFNEGEDLSYNIDGQYLSKTTASGCIDSIYNIDGGCLKETGTSKYRTRLEKTISDNLNKCVIDNVDGTLYIRG